MFHLSHEGAKAPNLVDVHTVASGDCYKCYKYVGVTGVMYLV